MSPRRRNGQEDSDDDQLLPEENACEIIIEKEPSNPIDSNTTLGTSQGVDPQNNNSKSCNLDSDTHFESEDVVKEEISSFEYPFLNTKPNNFRVLVTEPEKVGAYEISMSSEWIYPPHAPVIDSNKCVAGMTLTLNWCKTSPPNSHYRQYPRNGSDPLLRAAIDGGILDLSSVHVVISRNALRKLSSCFMPRSKTFTHDFCLTVEQISDNLTVIRQCSDERYGSAGFGIDFENKMTLLDPQITYGSSYYEAMSYNIGDYKVLVGCEVDALDHDNHSVELKTSKARDMFNKFYFFEELAHMRNIWMQMKLSGTKTLYLGEVEFPDVPLRNGDEASVTVAEIEINEVRNLGDFDAKDEKRVFAKVEELLTWIKEKLPFNAARRVAILKYIKEVNYQAARPERLAKPALRANKQFRARDAIPYRPAQDAIEHVKASLTLTIQEFSQDKSTISEKFYNESLLPVIYGEN